MSITAERKAEVIKSHARGDADTGSAEVQVAIMSERISNLTEHFKTHKKDNHSRRGLLKLVSARRSLLDHLKKSDVDRYQKLIETLGLRMQRHVSNARALVAKAAEQLSLSARAYHRILKVARTIADLDGAESVARVHAAEALTYRFRPATPPLAGRSGAVSGLIA